MSDSALNLPGRSSNSFRELVDALCKPSGLPFSHVFTAKVTESAVCGHGGLFGVGRIDCTATVL